MHLGTDGAIGTCIANDFSWYKKMRATSLRNRIRDFAFMAAAVAVLLVGSAALNDRWRQSLTSASQDAHQVATSPIVMLVSNAAASLSAVVRGFAADNTFLFGFLVVTAVLVVLMLRT